MVFFIAKIQKDICKRMAKQNEILFTNIDFLAFQALSSIRENWALLNLTLNTNR